MTAREEILSRIGPSSGSSLSRAAVLSSARGREEIVEQFAEYAAEYRATVTRVVESSIGDVVGRILGDRGSTSVVVPVDLPSSWVPSTVKVVPDEGLGHRDLDGIAAVVTGCCLAIAETGTIVLDAGEFQGRRAISLIPDHHVCVAREEQVVDSVAEAVEVLAEAVRRGQPLTWISGPSATSDIELNRVEGVHGPRHLDILLVRSNRLP